MSDGTSSPEIRTQKGDQSKSKIVTLEESTKPIRKVKGFGSDNYVIDLQFFDASGQRVNYYDPNDYFSPNRPYTEFNL